MPAASKKGTRRRMPEWRAVIHFYREKCRKNLPTRPSRPPPSYSFAYLKQAILMVVPKRNRDRGMGSSPWIFFYDNYANRHIGVRKEKLNRNILLAGKLLLISRCFANDRLYVRNCKSFDGRKTRRAANFPSTFIPGGWRNEEGSPGIP